MSCNDDILARLDSRCYGVRPQGHEPLYSGLQGLSNRQILWFVVGIPPVTAWEAWESLASQALLDSMMVSVTHSGQSKSCCLSVLNLETLSGMLCHVLSWGTHQRKRD